MLVLAVDDPPTPLRSSVDTGAGDQGGAPAELALVAGTKALLLPLLLSRNLPFAGVH